MSDSHDHLWDRLKRHRPRHSMKYEIVHVGFWSTVVFLLLMLLDVLAPSIFTGWYIWIGVAYLVCQMAEFVARDPLDWSEVTEGHLFSAIPALGGLMLKVANVTMLQSILTPFGLHVLNYWLVIAWVCLIFGILMAMRALAAPYRRDETEERKPTS